MRTSYRLIGAAAIAAALSLPACDRQSAQRAEATGNNTAQKIDNALDRTQQKLAEAGEKTRAELGEASDKLQPKLERAGEQIAQATEQTGRKIAAATDRLAERATSPQTRAAIGDTAITASIKTDFLKDPDLSVLKIEVETVDGVVTLNGLAATEDARRRAEKMASAVKGVRQVRNFLAVKRA